MDGCDSIINTFSRLHLMSFQIGFTTHGANNILICRRNCKSSHNNYGHIKKRWLRWRWFYSFL